MRHILFFGLISPLLWLFFGAQNTYAQFPYKDVPEQKAILCRTSVEEFLSYAEFNIDPAVLKKQNSIYEPRTDVVPMKDGKTASVSYSLKNISKESATAEVQIKLNPGELEVLSLRVDLPLIEDTSPIVATNIERQIRTSCASITAKMPRSQKATHGGYFNTLR